MAVVWMRVGAVNDSGALVRTKVDSGAAVRLVVADNPQMSSPVFFGPETPTARRIATVEATGLEPDTDYWWQIEHNGLVDTTYSPGRFQTPGTLGEPYSFEVVCSGDAGATPEYPGVGAVLAAARMSNHPVFSTIRERRPLMNFKLGDQHYYDLSSGKWGIVGGASLDNYHRAYDDRMLQPRQHHLDRETPSDEMFDDHCGYGNDKRGLEDPTAAANCLQVFTEVVPSGELPNPADGAYHGRQFGRVLFVMLDLRTQASANSDPDGPSKTMLGSLQKEWLHDLLAANVWGAEFLVLLSPSQWAATSHPDSWVSFGTEQNELVEMFGDTGWIRRMMVAYPDRHAAGVDTGSSNLFGGFPMLECAGLDATPATPSKRFDLGDGFDFPGRNQYGTIAVRDWGSGLAVTLSAWRGTQLLVSHTTAVPVGSVMSPAIVRSLSGSHQATFEAKVVTEHQVGDNPDGQEIPILSGNVRLDGTATVRGTLSMTTAGAGMWPRGRNRLLSPEGNEIFVRRGLEVGGQTTWVPLGYFRIDEIEQDNPPNGPIQITGSDRMASLIDSRLTAPRQYEAGSTLGAMFRDLVGEIYPDAAMFFEDNLDLAQLGRPQVAEKSRVGPLVDIATAVGVVLYWDGAGVLRFESVPDPGEPVWEVRSGKKGVLVEAARRVSRVGAPNGVVFTGEGADTQEPAYALVVDRNPRSPTFWGGKYGKIPKFHNSPLITTDAQAQSAARAMLRRVIGLPHSADFSAVPNPALQPWDPVRVTHRGGDRDLHVIQTATIPLTARAPLTATTREQTLVVLGSV